ncbi:MAG TPA: AAA family ATPase [Trebonia sp.]|jgi:non-specific serine/threonine protein kinase
MQAVAEHPRSTLPPAHPGQLVSGRDASEAFPAFPAQTGFPAETTSFVGRAAELAHLTATLRQARLVTVTGPGGVGKTRLAYRAAAQAAPWFPDGACLAELSEVSEPRLVPDAVAASLGLPGVGARPALDAVTDYLADRRMLLVLDPCEHLTDACAELTEILLQSGPGITVLATSRQPLDVAGENICALAPLAVPALSASVREAPSPAAALSPREVLPRQGDAADLFAQRAAAARPGFVLTRDNADDVTAICRRLDGIPLALELAAARLAEMPLRELAGRLPELIGEPRESTGRHETLGAAIAWSYNLCTPAERTLWQRLSVFAGPFETSAAEDVCTGRDLPRAEVLGTIISLVDKSVLTREAASGKAGEFSRYRMLDTLREYGAARLADSGTEAGVRGRLLSRYLSLARHFGGHFLDDDQVDQFRRFRLEHASIRAALAYAFQDPRSESARDGAEIVAALFPYWQGACLQREGIYWLDRVAGSFPGTTPERAHALIVRCYLRTEQGQAELAVTDGQDGVRLADELRDEAASARGRLFLHQALAMAGRLEEAKPAGEDARARLTALGDRNGLLLLNTQMTALHVIARNFPEAVAWYERSLRELGPTAERWQTSWLHSHGSYAYANLPGKRAEQLAALRVALAGKYEIGDQIGAAFVLESFSLRAAQDGRFPRSAWLAGAALPIWERAGAVLGNVPPLVDHHNAVIRGLREALGDRQFDAVFTRGGQHPLDQVILAAASDADELPPLPSS